jgi:hypothetical protein
MRQQILESLYQRREQIIDVLLEADEGSNPFADPNYNPYGDPNFHGPLPGPQSPTRGIIPVGPPHPSDMPPFAPTTQPVKAPINNPINPRTIDQPTTTDPDGTVHPDPEGRWERWRNSPIQPPNDHLPPATNTPQRSKMPAWLRQLLRSLGR